MTAISDTGGNAIPISTVLARAAAGTRIENVPPEVRERVLDVFIDILGVFALGSDRAELVRLREMVAYAPGGATVVGSSRPTATAVAALLNGMAPSVYQIDEGQRESRGHGGIHIAPVVFALAEELGSDANAMLSAFLAGYEVAVRLGKSLGGTKSTFHPHGNWGTVGAAVAAAHLLSDGDERIIATAIDGAAAVTLYPDRAATTYGASAHHLYVGLGAHIGLIWGYAALSGLTAVPGCLENFFGPSAGVAFKPETLTDGVDPETGSWSRYEILSSYVKFFASCAHTHTAIGSTIALMKEQGVSPENVERIDVRAFRGAASLNLQEVDNDLAARFSIPFTVAATLAQGKFSVDSLADEVLADPKVRALARRVFVHHDPDLDAGYPEGRPVIMTVQLKDGTTREQRMDWVFGDREIPATREEVHGKALALLAHRFGQKHADLILRAALDLGEGGDLATLSRALRDAAEAR